MDSWVAGNQNQIKSGNNLQKPHPFMLALNVHLQTQFTFEAHIAVWTREITFRIVHHLNKFFKFDETSKQVFADLVIYQFGFCPEHLLAFIAFNTLLQRKHIAMFTNFV